MRLLRYCVVVLTCFGTLACSSTSIRKTDASGSGEDAGVGGAAGVANGGTGGTAGGGTGGTAGGGAPGVFRCDELVGAVCNRLSTCFPWLLAVTYGSVTACVSESTPGCNEQLDAEGSDPTAGADCADAIATQPCDALTSGDGAVCELRGTLADGAPCLYDRQCRTGRCYRNTEACGECVTPAPGGGDCSDRPCEPGYSCNTSSTCVAPAARGQQCGPDTRNCDTCLFCNGGLCAPVLDLGAPCDPALGACDSLQGQACLQNANGESTCQQLQLAELNEPCGAFLDNVTCVGGTYCSPDTSVCVPLPGEGEPCDALSGGRCRSGAQCDDGICRVPAPPTCN
jgi:hypothetical protein